jgi:hypothetical protein
LREPAACNAWLKPLRDCDWVVFIEPPPTEQANPTQVLKYLARYLTGGAISDGRLIGHACLPVWLPAGTPPSLHGKSGTNRTLADLSATSSPVAVGIPGLLN